MSLWKSKIGVAIGTFVVPFCATVAPIKVAAFVEKRGDRGRWILSLLMCFGGGVFFGTYLIHMAVEAKDILHAALIDPKDWAYPLSEVIMGFGFFLVLFVDKLLVVVISKNAGKLARQSSMETPEVCSRANSAFTSSTDTESSLHSSKDHIPNDTGAHSVVRKHSIHACGNGDVKDVPEAGPKLGHQHGAEELLYSSRSTRAVILMVALSLHRVFEGMGMGLQHTVKHAWHLFAAIMCHEIIVGFSLGLRLVGSRWTTRRILVVVAIISLVQPVGVVIGTLISEVGKESNGVEIANGVLQSIATGTFIYVTFFEILGNELHEADLLQTTAVLIGFGVMALLELIPEQGLVTSQAALPCLNQTDSTGG